MLKSKRQIFYFFFIFIIVSVLIIPVVFNFLFLWESGYSRGKTEDWFTFYASIFGGLIGGFFTYLALIYTLEQTTSKLKEEENFIIQDTILTSREYLNILLRSIDEISELVPRNTKLEMENQYELNLESRKDEDIFKGGIVHLEPLDKYTKDLVLLNNTVHKFKNEIKTKYIELKNTEDREFQEFLFNSYLALAHYDEYIKESLEKLRFNNKEFIYQFCTVKDNVGFKGIVISIYVEIQDIYYPKYIRNNSDQVGDLMRKVNMIHIRG